MIFIGDQIIAAWQAVSFSIPGVTVKDFYDISKLTPPLLALDERPGNEGVYLGNQPTVMTNIFTLEAYGKQMLVGGKPVTAKMVATTILLEADKLLNEQYGLTMTGSLDIAPYSDPSVCRVVARYVAYIDTRTNLIYRRIQNGRST